MLLIAYTSWGNLAFGTAPVSLNVWLFAAGCGIVMLALEELRKLFVRRWADKGAQNDVRQHRSGASG